MTAFIHKLPNLSAVYEKSQSHPITKSNSLRHIRVLHQSAFANNFTKSKTAKILNNIFLFSFFPLPQRGKSTFSHNTQNLKRIRDGGLST